MKPKSKEVTKIAAFKNTKEVKVCVNCESEFNHTSWILLYRGDLLIVGGRRGELGIDTTFHLDFHDGSVTNTQEMNGARDSCALVLWHDFVLAFGGNHGVALKTAEAYQLEIS